LLERIIVTFTPAKDVAEVLIVFVVDVGLFGMNIALGVGFFIGSQVAWARRGYSCRATVACKVSLLEDFHQRVLAMALDRAGIADAGGLPVRQVFCRGVACQAGKDVLPKGPQNLGAAFNTLGQWLVTRAQWCKVLIRDEHMAVLHGRLPRGALDHEETCGALESWHRQ
jgi:hypothetical protein